MEKKYLFWETSTRSGLCDRLVDVMIVAAHAKSLNKILLMSWKEQPINDKQREIWNPIRFEDYKIENFREYFSLPEEYIKIVEDKDLYLYSNERELFLRYLGGIYSPFSFYESLSDKTLYSKELFLQNYENICNLILPTEKLLSLFSEKIPDNLISVHLRRTDKVIEKGRGNADHGINIENMEKLDEDTLKILENIVGGYTLKNIDFKIFFCSDDFEIRRDFESKISKENKIFTFNLPENIPPFVRTYVDLYILMKSKFIILSQHHSNYSLFASLVGKGNLIYLFNDDIIINAKYNNFQNVIYFLELNEVLDSKI